MIKDILLLVLAAFVSYFIGTINFSKIIAWKARKKDITKIGSHNPGTMNMLRSFGFGLALLTFIGEIVKAGLTCLTFKLLYQHFGIWGGGEFVYYLAATFIMLGYNFPVWSKFKGGKGVACFVGIFLFSSIWHVSLGWFAICFVLFLFIEYGSVVSLTYTGGLTIATILFTWLTGFYPTWISIYVTCIITSLYILTLIKHRGNISRLIHGCENKIDFKEKLKNFFAHKKDGEVDKENEQIAENNAVNEMQQEESGSEENSSKEE